MTTNNSSNIPQNGDKVWVSILANGIDQPPVLAPGIVIDARVGTREVIRSQRKGGNLTFNDTVVVVSYRQTPTKSFYTERPERLTGLTRRTEHLPVVDGKKGEDPIPNLRQQAQRDLDALIAPVAKSQTKEAAAMYAKLPALGSREAVTA